MSPPLPHPFPPDSPAEISPADLGDLLARAEVLAAHDTGLAGWLRHLLLDGVHLIQEETPEREILVRALADEGSAARFVADRLAAYERMWDG